MLCDLHSFVPIVMSSIRRFTRDRLGSPYHIPAIADAKHSPVPSRRRLSLHLDFQPGCLGGPASRPRLQAGRRAAHPGGAAVEYLRVEHRRLDVGGAEQLLNRADFVPAREQVCGHGIPKV
jgi:hypothetical protein